MTSRAALDFSVDEEESGIAERAEATLRSHYATSSHTGHGGGGAATPAPKRRPAPKKVPVAAPAVGPLVSSAEASSTASSSSSAAAGSARGSKRGSAGSASSAKRRAPPPPSHSFFLPPMPVTAASLARIAAKGAYRPDASAPSAAPAAPDLNDLGVPEAEHEAVRGALAAGAAVEAAGADAGEADVSDSASFSRTHAVTAEAMYPAGACPICEETMTFAYHAAKRSMGSGIDGGSSTAVSRLISHHQRQRERMLRAIQARANLSDHDQRCHAVLYHLEKTLRGVYRDDRIFRLLILLRREWIEKKLEHFQIQYVPWTMAMLRIHFDPASGHFRDQIRQVITQYDQCTELQTVMFNAAHGAGAIDYRAADRFIRLGKESREYREEIKRLLEEEQPDRAEAMRALSEAIVQTTRDPGIKLLTQDPRTAAGAKPQGGDNRQTAGLNVVEEPHGAYEQSFLSGY
jgi:hypothetical protein